MFEFPDRRHLGDGDVVEDAKGANHDASKQESLGVDVAAQSAEVANGFVGEAGQF